MVFLHGYMSCKESFYYQIKYFARRHEVIAFDFPGFGRSSPIATPFSVGDYALWLGKFLKNVGVGRAYFIAHSFGARVAVRFLAEEDVCEKLVITGGAGFVKERSPSYMRRVKAYRRVKKFFPRFAEKHFGSEEYRKLSPVMKESYKKIVNEDLSRSAERIKCPTLLVYGADDVVTPFSEEGERFSATIPDNRLIVMRGDHFCFSQYPEIFNSHVSGFFGDK